METVTLTLDNITIKLTREQVEKALEELDSKQTDYPICMKNISGKVVVFEELYKGRAFDKYGKLGKLEEWRRHTDSEFWEQVAYDKERNLYDNQYVYAWDNGEELPTEVRYDAIHKCAFAGPLRRGSKYKYYAPSIKAYVEKYISEDAKWIYTHHMNRKW